MGKKLKIVGEGAHAHEACSVTPKVTVQDLGSTGLKRAEQYVGRAVVVTLGCAKNQVDSEVMLGVLRKNGYEIVTDVAGADVAVVNTCGFLESAVKESIDCVLEIAEQKKTGRLRQLIMAGCAVERYKGDIKKALPEVDAFITLDDVLKVSDAAKGTVFENSLSQAARPYFLYDDTMPRYLSTKKHFAYVKISEGCNRPCTFCIIPKIRGEMRSRSLDSVVREVQQLGAQGVREINLIAQDLTAYGADRKGPRLAELLRKIDETKAVDWVRLLYAYPVGVDAELVDCIAELPSVVEYLDIPLQHASERLLKEMKRPLGKFSPRAVTEFIHARQPTIHIRTTFIVGFPGETEQDIKELEQLVGEGHYSNVGVFTYSPEEGTPAFSMPSQVDDALKQERRARVMEAQQRAVAKRLSEFVGQELEVLLEGVHEDTELLFSGRSRFQAPEVDGTVIINDSLLPEEELVSGAIGTVRITEVAGYDLVGELTGISKPAGNLSGEAVMIGIEPDRSSATSDRALAIES